MGEWTASEHRPPRQLVQKRKENSRSANREATSDTAGHNEQEVKHGPGWHADWLMQIGRGPGPEQGCTHGRSQPGASIELGASAFDAWWSCQGPSSSVGRLSGQRETYKRYSH